MRRFQRRRTPFLPLCAVVFLILATSSPSQPAPTVPDLALPEVRSGTFHLRVHPAQPLLLGLLQTVPDTANTPSRSQVVCLDSMAQQYGPRGLRVAVVDASAFTNAAPPPHNALLNASYDWHLNMPLLLDPKGELAHQLGLKQVPTTFLFAADGTIVQKWQRPTRPATLAQGIERLLGGPLSQSR